MFFPLHKWLMQQGEDLWVTLPTNLVALQTPVHPWSYWPQLPSKLLLIQQNPIQMSPPQGFPAPLQGLFPLHSNFNLFPL